MSVRCPLLFVLFISDLPLHVTKYFTVDYNSIVNCEIFADDITLAVYDTYPVSVENELQKSIKEVSVWCGKNKKICYLIQVKNSPLNLNLSFKTDHTDQVHEHRHIDIIIDDEFNC